MSYSITNRQLLSTLRIDGPVGDRIGTVLILALLPVPLVSLLFAAHSIATGTPSEAYSLPAGYLFYGLVNLLVVGVTYWLLAPAQRRAVFLFERPSTGELLAAVAAFVIGLGVYQGTAAVSATLGYQLQGLDYSLTDPTSAAIVVVGAVILAPLTEEILYRGLILGALTSRGVGPVTATVLMTAIFAVVHLPNFGVAGTLFISVWGFLPAILRLRFENLSGAVLMHMLNNAFAYVLVVMAGWA